MSRDDANDSKPATVDAWEQEFLNQDGSGYIGTPSKRYRCPKCHGVLQLKQGKNGAFWGCENYPKCDYSANDEDGRPVRAKKYFCPLCGGQLRKKTHGDNVF